MSSDKEQPQLIDSEQAHIRKVAGCYVQTVPKKWYGMAWLKRFFEVLSDPEGQGEIRLLSDNGQPVLELRVIPKEERTSA